MPLAPGMSFADFRIIRLLGSGAMGEVYLVEHPRLPRRDALKILPTEVSSDPDYRQRFTREADLAATLWHPNIVAIHDRGEFEGQLWISMDHVDGYDAAHTLRSQFPSGMPVAEALEVVTAVASALDHAHSRGLLHRDVKPSNILLADDPSGERRVLLSDFGIARLSDDISGLTATNMAVGSVAYAAPEQLMGEPMDGRADQYALAATAFHLLTGSPPFVHTNPAVVISKHLNAPPPPIAEKRPELALLDGAVSKALAKNPLDRYPHCQDFADAFARGAGGERRVGPTASTQVAVPSAKPLPEAAKDPAPLVRPAVSSANAPQRPRSMAAIVVALTMAVLALAAGGFAATQLIRSEPSPPVAAPRWQPYVDYGKTFAVDLMSLNYETADRDAERIINGSTGQFQKDFIEQREEFKKTAVDSRVVTTATVNAAALDSFDEDNQTARVLIVATTKQTDQEPRAWRLQLTIEKQGDGYKASTAEFVE